MPDHHFNPILAQKYGIDVAVFLHNIYFWIKYNKAYQKNFYDNRYWTFNSLSAFCEAHPYWSRRQIERIVAACKKNELLFTLLYEINGDQKATRRVLYYCTVSRPGENASTTGKTKTPQTDTMNLSAVPLADGRIRARTKDNTVDTVFNGWYKAVWQPKTEV